MKSLVLVIALAACGGGKSTGPNEPASKDAGVVKDTRTPFEKRLEASCMQVAKKLTACAVADTDADLAAGRTTQKAHDEDVSQKFTDALTAKYMDGCNVPDKRSSRQIRVLEVCFKEEQECDPLLDCLDHVNKKD